MKVGILIFVFADLRDFLVGKSILSHDGTLIPPSPEQYLEIAQHVEGTLKAHGVVLEEHVDKVINALPLIFQLIF